MSMNETLEQIKNFDPNNIDFEKMGIWPLPAKIFVLVLLAIIIFSLTFYLKISELHDDLELVKAKEQTLRKTYETKSFEAANLDAYRAQMDEMDKTFKSLLSRLPSDAQVPGLLDDIGARGRESGLTINATTMEPERAAEFYIEVPFRINADGGYHDMGGFVSGIAAMPRIVTLHDYTITRKKDSMLNMQISAKTYKYKAQVK
ncbi:type 4a pilus biogenesis protein PilO [Cellvibrio sp.]|uniref:type 4a pilus biogenesis protein PilO n=1 Tax=Cellvibrio sp. TaxID=1965322 RepID=UPI003964802C